VRSREIPRGPLFAVFPGRRNAIGRIPDNRRAAHASPRTGTVARSCETSAPAVDSVVATRAVVAGQDCRAADAGLRRRLAASGRSPHRRSHRLRQHPRCRGAPRDVAARASSAPSPAAATITGIVHIAFRHTLIHRPHDLAQKRAPPDDCHEPAIGSAGHTYRRRSRGSANTPSIAARRILRRDMSAPLK